MRRSTLIVLLFLFALTAGACVSGTKTTDNGSARKPKGPNDQISIGFSMDTLKEERWQRDKELVEKHAAEVGAKLDVEVAQGSDTVQVQQADTMLTKGVDVLIIAPHNGEVWTQLIDKAHKQGVPVISYDRLIKNVDVELYVSHQVVKMGEMQGKYALDHVPKGNYVLIGGSQTDNNALLLRQGQMNILKPAIDRGDIKIVADQYARDWLASEAHRITEDALTKSGNDVQAIVASNDGTAGGAASALPPSLEGKVLITGQDAQLDACQRIVEGRQTMTVYKSIKPLAYSAVDSALKLARGEKVDAPDKINNGKIDVPSILQEPVSVDKSNMMQTVIKDGYHTMEEVYKNVPKDQWPKPTASNSSARGSSLMFAAVGFFLSAFVLVRT
jgi:D-xylose transport system substrate-binding protein